MWQDAMTSKKAMQSGSPTAARLWLVLGLGILVGPACTGHPKMDQPSSLTSPYPGPKLWAVAPLRNESGTTLVDTVVLADKLTQRLADVPGITMVPVNRVLAAMASLELASINSVGDAMKVSSLIGTDGLIVGTLTAWDPYEPPKVGATIQLISREKLDASSTVDPRQLSSAATGDRLGTAATWNQPVAQASGYFDAANHQVLGDLHNYAVGRTPLESPSGWRRYLLSMDLYTEFVSDELIRRLLESEWQRLHQGPPPQADPTDN